MIPLLEIVDRRRICLGLWVAARHRSGEPIDNTWADDALRAAQSLRRRDTWAVVGAALGQQMTAGDQRRAHRHVGRLGAYRAVPPVAAGGEQDDRLRQWRRGTVHRWLLVGELLQRRRAAGHDVTPAWLESVHARGNPRGEDLRPGDQPPALDPAAVDDTLDVPVVAVEVDGDGPTHALPPGVRWYPQYRTVSLRAVSAHLLVTGPGPANAVRSGEGFGSAIREGAGHGNAVRRDGLGDAVRTGEGHGDAYREMAGEGLAIRAGSGHGHAISTSAGASGAVRDGAGHGNAVAETGTEGALRDGDGRGTAIASAGPARRDGNGRGDAVRIGPQGDVVGEDVAAVRAGTGDGDAYGEPVAGGAARIGGGEGRIRHWREWDHPIWSALLEQRESGWGVDPPPRTSRHAAGDAVAPIHRIRVLRTGERRIPKRSPVCYEAETHTLVLDTAEAGSVEVIGRGDINVERRGAGPGDAIRSEAGAGNALRTGPGAGHAVRRGTGSGNAVRVGGGVGNAAVGCRVLGDARVHPPATGEVLRPPDPKGAGPWSGLGRPDHP